MSFVTKQPAKGAYLLIEALVTAFIRLPFWFLLALPRNNRARPSWTVQREIIVKLIKQLTTIITR